MRAGWTSSTGTASWRNSRASPHPALRATFSRMREKGRHSRARIEAFQALAAPFAVARETRAGFERARRGIASGRVRPTLASPRTRARRRRAIRVRRTWTADRLHGYVRTKIEHTPRFG